MLKTLVTKVVGTRFRRELKRIRPIVDAIRAHEERLKGLSDAAVQAQTDKFRRVIAERTGTLAAEVDRLKRAKHDCPDAEQRLKLTDQLARAEGAYAKEVQRAFDAILPEAFATVRDACRRLVGTKVVVTGHELAWDMVPYDEQLIGAVVLEEGKVAETATGGRKTLGDTLQPYPTAHR